MPTGGVQSNNICMLISSVDNCPSGFAEVATVYTEYTDKRDCTCDCGPGGKCQGGEILLYSSGDCTGDSMLSVPAATSCEDTSDLGAESSFKANGGSWVSGPCMPLLDEDGEIDLKGKKKVCCLL